MARSWSYELLPAPARSSRQTDATHCSGVLVLGYVFAGIALGSIYAIAASGLVVTYVSSGVLNFAFGSMAYFLARFYYYLNTQEAWSQVPAVIVSVVLAG